MADDANVTLTQPVGDDDHVLGPENANATLVQYGDYECDYCRQLHPEIREVIHRTDGLRFVYRHQQLRGFGEIGFRLLVFPQRRKGHAQKAQ